MNLLPGQGGAFAKTPSYPRAKVLNFAAFMFAAVTYKRAYIAYRFACDSYARPT